MIPLPPLDGGRVAVGLLPKYYSLKLAKLEKYGLFIIIGALFILPLIGNEIGISLKPIHWFIQYVSYFLVSIISFLTGFTNLIFHTLDTSSTNFKHSSIVILCN